MMTLSYRDFLEPKEKVEIVEAKEEPKKQVQKNIKSKPEDLLRDSGFKIKLITHTAFGTQIDFAKKYDDNKIKETLSSFIIKIKDKSVFVEN